MDASNDGIPGALLLAVDLQPVFTKVIHKRLDVLRRCRFALSAARMVGLPVAFTEQVPQKLGGTDPALRKLAPGAQVFAKTAFSAAADDSIVEALRERSIEHLILCGVETSICVYLTAAQAIHSGFQVTVLVDAVGCRRPADAGPCLEALARAGAYVLPAESVFYSLVGSATHPAFKEFTRLVKDHA